MRSTLLAAALFLAHIAITEVGYRSGFVGETAVIWPSVGFFAGAIYARGWNLTPLFMAAYFFEIYVIRGDTALSSAILTLSETSAAVCFAAMMRSRGARLSLARTDDVFGLMVASAVAAAFSSYIGYAGLSGDALAPFRGAHKAALFAGWYLSQVLGLLFVAPLWTVRIPRWQDGLSWSALELASTVAAVFAVTVATFHGAYPLAYAAVPILLWVGLRFGHEGASIAAIAFSVGTIVSIRTGADALETLRPLLTENVALALQAALLSVGCTSLIGSTLVRNEAARQAADKALTAKNLFVANMSHEIRDPLGAVAGYAELAARLGVAAGPLADSFSRIQLEADRALRLVNDSLDLAKCEASSLKVECVPFSPRSSFEESAAAVKRSASRAGLEVDATIGALPERLTGDEARFRQILIEMGLETARSLRRGRIRFEAEWTPPRLDGTPGHLACCVRGVGPARERSARRAISRAPQRMGGRRRWADDFGSGVGLALAAELASLMNGEIQERRAGKGESICLSFVVRCSEPTAEQEALARQRAVDARALQARLAGARILLADDSLENRLLISRFLSVAGASVECAEDGAEAVARARALPFDLIVLDLTMPGMDGLEAARALRASGYAGPLVALTGHDSSSDRARCVEAGFDDHVSKPVGSKELIARLSGHIGIRPIAAEAT